MAHTATKSESEKTVFINPVTGRNQKVSTSTKTTKLHKLGFDFSGAVCYQEYEKGDIMHLAGSIIDAVGFVSFSL